MRKRSFIRAEKEHDESTYIDRYDCSMFDWHFSLSGLEGANAFELRNETPPQGRSVGTGQVGSHTNGWALLDAVRRPKAILEGHPRQGERKGQCQNLFWKGMIN